MVGSSAQVVLDVLARQRACRRFSPEPVEDADLARMLDAACRAPSAENSQPWVFVVVRAADRRAAIWFLAEKAWAGGGRQASTGLPPPLFDDVDRGLTGGLAAAPVTIVVGADLRRCRPETAASSVFPAVQNLLVAGTALGLGSTLTTIATVFADELRSVVELPEEVVPLAVVPVGHPARALGRSRREPFAAHTHRERYGDTW